MLGSSSLSELQYERRCWQLWRFMRSCRDVLPFLKVEDRSIYCALRNEVSSQLLVIFLGSKLVKIQNDTCSFASKACMCVYTCQWHSDTGSTIQFQCWKKLDEFVSYSQLSVPMATTQRCLIALEPGPLNYPWIKKNIMTTVQCASVCVCAHARACTRKQYLCSQHAKTRRWVCCVFIRRVVGGSRRVRKNFCLFAFSNIYSSIFQAMLISPTPDSHRITSNNRLRLIIAVFCLLFRQMLIVDHCRALYISAPLRPAES